VICIYTKAD